MQESSTFSKEQILKSVQMYLNHPACFKKFEEYRNNPNKISSRALEFFINEFILQQHNERLDEVSLMYKEALAKFGSKHFQFFARGDKMIFKSIVDDSFQVETTLGHINFEIWCIESSILELFSEYKNVIKQIRKTKSSKKSKKNSKEKTQKQRERERSKKKSKSYNKSKSIRKRSISPFLDCLDRDLRPISKKSTSAMKFVRPTEQQREFIKRLGF